MTSSTNSENDFKERLIGVVKKEVKQVMEESVTRKFVHEESGSVTSLCGAVEACLSQGLRRRALGLFKTSSTTALLHKIGKHCREAGDISQKIQDLESCDPTEINRKSSSSSESVTKPTLKKNSSLPTQVQRAPLPKYLWIRLALFDKQLAKIIDFLVTNAGKYYDKDALVADPDYGSILSSLLVGPCALDYSRTRTPDHYWTDPPADELLQRHRISSGHSTPPSARRSILNFRRHLNAASSSDDSIIVNPIGVRNSSTTIAKDYVESIHQNARATLLFGKNNVRVLPIQASAAAITDPMPGYLSLHQTATGLTIKWTPNQLMNGFTDDAPDKSVYWDYALHVRLDEVVYVHCHQDNETGGTIILVGQDGVQRPPIHFPKGGHMLTFLSCIETGLLPRGRLDPPLWSQRNGGNGSGGGGGGGGGGGANSTTKRRRPLPALRKNEETTKDYVFRIIDNINNRSLQLRRTELLDPHASIPTTNKHRINHLPSTSSESSSSKSLSIDQQTSSSSADNNNHSPPSTIYIEAVCVTMKRQIISRAFYGWLAYCRHLSTVRTHLTGLVNTEQCIIRADGHTDGITIERWHELCVDGVCIDASTVYRLTYFGGVAHELRKELWPYLLGHYKFGSTSEQRRELDEETKQAYENTMSEWLAVEAIVRQRDKETQACAIAKLSSESTTSEAALPPSTDDFNNDVFEEDQLISSSDDDDEVRTKQNTITYESDGDAGGGGQDFVHNVIVTNASVDDMGGGGGNNCVLNRNNLEAVAEEMMMGCIEAHGLASPAQSACVSPASSNGGVYSQELLETFGLNLHRIEKDVQRCDRNYWYFTVENLDKLRNVMCTYVWEHLDIGYVQGMCDLVAPLLVIFNDESLTYACFCHLMERMVENFQNGSAMDNHFANMRALIQILDAEMYELMHSHGDYTHFYFCYRWFLLDFKREFVYSDVNATWEVIWAAQHVASGHFVLFLALALLETYRDIILSNCMDFTDIIKFFNEMAERHDAAAILNLAKELVLQLQVLIENK